MAKIRVMSNQRRVGRVGDTTFYVRDGEQIARQSRNNSNYGESASRSFLQQSRRVKWANLVNLFKTMSSWQPKAYEFKKSGQTDYNTFMSLNINSSEICLTKDMAQNGCACWDSYQISRGSISPIQLTGDISSEQAVSSLVTTLSIAGTTTIGELSADIIANNLGWNDGDNLAIIGAAVFVDSRNYPYADTNYIEMTLNVGSSVTLQDADLWNWIGSAEGKIIVSPPGAGIYNYTHVALIHTRKVDGRLIVSTQSLVQCATSPADQYKGSNWQQECIDSYGESVEVPLDPSFLKATIEEVTINGSPVSSPMGRTIEVAGQATLVVQGKNLTNETLSLYHDGVLYTPLASDGQSLTYILGDNGSNRVMLNGSYAFTVAVSGITVPGILPINMSVAQQKGTAIEPISDNVGERVSSSSTNCINAPIRETDFYNHIQCSFGSLEMQESDFEGVNCTINNYGQTSSRTRVVVSVDDDSRPSYLTYQGFIVAVFNYSQ